MNLKKLTNDQLHFSTKKASQEEREATTRLLHHLCEVQRRRLYAEYRCDSLFEYCVKELKMSDPHAARRTNAAKLLKEFPVIEEKIISGELSLTAVSQAQVFFKREGDVSKEFKADILEKIENQSTRKTDKILLSHSQEPEKHIQEKVRQLTPNLTEAKLVLDEETMENIERLKEIWSHSIPGASLSEVVKKMAGHCREAVDPVRKAERAQAKRRQNASKVSPEEKPAPAQESKVPPAPESKMPTPPETRYIPSIVSDEVWIRDEGCCSFKDKSGKRCGSRYLVQLDHYPLPYAMGGAHTPENLRLLCFTHNQLHAVQSFGAGVLRFSQT